jgi:predicted nucleic acid-binding Zn ribbon protein
VKIEIICSQFVNGSSNWTRTSDLEIANPINKVVVHGIAVPNYSSNQTGVTSKMNTNTCLHCSQEIKPKRKFCSRSCSASYNNKGVRRHGEGPKKCLHCGEDTKSSQRKYCSYECANIEIGLAKRTWSNETERKKLQAFYFMSYYTKKKNQTPPDADLELIKEFYKNCPEGYEVDHIIPINKGGLHHQDNLQYLTISENRSKGDKLNWRPTQDSNLD